MGVVLKDPTTEKVVAKGKKTGGLYKLFGLENKAFDNVDVLAKSCLVSNSGCNKEDKIDLLHARLGHVSLSKLKHLPNVGSSQLSNFSCDICILAKHHKLPFQYSGSYASENFELIHMDVWGPYKVPTYCGARYFLTVVDDHTRATWTFLMNNKEQVYGKVAQLLEYVETQFNTKVKRIRSDNGT